MPFALSDLDPASPPELRDGIFHPVLSLLQMYLDPADPLNHAAAMAPATTGGHHVFQVYGQNDTYAASASRSSLTRIAANLGVSAHDLGRRARPSSPVTPDYPGVRRRDRGTPHENVMAG